MATQRVVPVVADVFTAGELQHGLKFWARADFKCPRCHNEHIELINGDGPTPTKVICHCVVDGKEVVVKPWTRN
jgi:hypothetical protein